MHREQTPSERQCVRLFSDLNVYTHVLVHPLSIPVRTVGTSQDYLPFTDEGIEAQREEASFPSHSSLTKAIERGPQLSAFSFIKKERS